MRLSAPIYKLKRNARMLARKMGVPLGEALDRIAVGEGLRNWSHLVSQWSAAKPAGKLLPRLEGGNLILLGARPGHGKTMLGVELAIEAARQHDASSFFSLQDNDSELRSRFGESGSEPDGQATPILLDTSDCIDAEHIAEQFSKQPVDVSPSAAQGRLVVLDYLQLLSGNDRGRHINAQLAALRDLARSANARIVLLSQIKRSFDPAGGALPGMADLRLGDVMDRSLFDQAIFMHDGRIALHNVT
jgi:replicative DNA helicase